MGDPQGSGTVACRVFGHRYRFAAEGERMLWRCSRCGTGDSKRYASAAEAERFATALDVDATSDLGKRAPLVGLLPLRVWRWWRQRA